MDLAIENDGSFHSYPQVNCYITMYNYGKIHHFLMGYPRIEHILIWVNYNDLTAT